MSKNFAFQYYLRQVNNGFNIVFIFLHDDFLEANIMPMENFEYIMLLSVFYELNS